MQHLGSAVPYYVPYYVVLCAVPLGPGIMLLVMGVFGARAEVQVQQLVLLQHHPATTQSAAQNRDKTKTRGQVQ